MGHWVAVFENEASTCLCSINLVSEAGNHKWQGWEYATSWEHLRWCWCDVVQRAPFV